ncbi:GNAT family N-acetyltransferase [Agarivorans sp. Alg241-V36]|nr:GNAT family N-acetyltransferase [Agarivorans sp. Alg241-V36]
MKPVSKTVDPNDSDYLSLISELNQELGLLTGDTGESSFSTESFNPSTDSIVVVYSDKKPMGTGCIRYINKGTCEIKRMYSKKKGVGKFLISELERVAIQLGYSEAVLSTRRINENAVNFYSSQRYLEIDGYGNYVGVERSICMGKKLTP